MSDRSNPYMEFVRSQQSPSGSVPRPLREGSVVPETSSGHDHGGQSEAPTHTALPIERMSVDDILRAPGHDALQRLHPEGLPGTKWFKIDNSVAKVVREVWEADYKEFSANISQTSAAQIDQWFKAFAQRYHWDSGLTQEVKKEFKLCLTERMTDQTYKWKQRWIKMGAENGKPKGLRQDIWEKLIAYWSSDSSVVKSDKTKKSRRSNIDGPAPATHRSGKTSFTARARTISEKSGDDVPDLIAVLVETKRKADGTFVDVTSGQLFQDVTTRMEELRQNSDPESMGSVQLTTAEKNQIFKEVAPRKKGKIYGVGSLHSRIEGSSSTAFSSGSDDGLKEQVESQKQLIATQQEKLQQLELEAQSKTAENEAIKSILSRMSSQFGDPILQDMIKNLTGASASSSQGPSTDDNRE